MSFHVLSSAQHVRSEPLSPPRCLKYTPEKKAGSNSGSNFAQMLSLRSILGGPPPHDVPTSLSLCGELDHKTECLGTYLLAPQRTAHGKPVWKHATEDRWIACISTGIWKVQEGVDVGVNALGFMKLETANLPHQSTTVWEEYHGKEWLKAPTCKADGGGPPPVHDEGPPVHDEGPPVALGTDEYAFICHDGRLMYMSTSPTTRC